MDYCLTVSPAHSSVGRVKNVDEYRRDRNLCLQALMKVRDESCDFEYHILFQNLISSVASESTAKQTKPLDILSSGLVFYFHFSSFGRYLCVCTNTHKLLYINYEHVTTNRWNAQTFFCCWVLTKFSEVTEMFSL